MLGKYEAKFINPVDSDFSYNNFYQINKNYSYKNGKINKISYEIGKIDTCFVGGVSKSMLKKSRLNFDKIEKCK